MAYFNFFHKVNSSQFPNHWDRFLEAFGLWFVPLNIDSIFFLREINPLSKYRIDLLYQVTIPISTLINSVHSINLIPDWFLVEQIITQAIGKLRTFSMNWFPCNWFFFIEWELNWFVSMFRCVLYWSCWVNPFYEINSISSFGWAQAI